MGCQEFRFEGLGFRANLCRLILGLSTGSVSPQFKLRIPGSLAELLLVRVFRHLLARRACGHVHCSPPQKRQVSENYVFKGVQLNGP